MWSKYVTRRIAIQVAQAWNFGWGQLMEDVFGVSVRNTLVFRDDKKTEYYVDDEQHKKYVQGLYGLLKNNDFLLTFHKTCQINIENILSEISSKFEEDLENLDNKDLLSIYSDFVLPRVNSFYIYMWSVFNIAEPTVNAVREGLKKYVSEDELDKYLLKLSTPLEPNDVIKERIDLLKIAISSDSKLLDGHWKKYRHIPMFDFDHEPYSKIHFEDELGKINNPAKELKEIENNFNNNKKEFEDIISEIKPDKNFRVLLNFLKENVWLRDYRDMIRQKLNLELNKFYKILGSRLGLDIQEVAVLTNQEIIDHLRENKTFSKKEIAERKKAYLLIQKSDKVEVYSGKNAIEKFVTEVGNEKLNQTGSIRGIAASSGTSKGTARIIFTNKDLNKVEEGDILIATMTRQDFVPYIKKSAALVTDEGGLTCHAAIIARELKIPCIVGTRMATEVFKDGDLVEVDANKGIIKRV